MALCEFCEENETRSGYMCDDCQAYYDHRANTCPLCGDKTYALGLCRQHYAEDEAIRRENERNTPRPMWAQKLSAGPEARHDW